MNLSIQTTEVNIDRTRAALLGKPLPLQIPLISIPMACDQNRLSINQIKSRSSIFSSIKRITSVVILELEPWNLHLLLNGSIFLPSLIGSKTLKSNLIESSQVVLKCHRSMVRCIPRYDNPCSACMESLTNVLKVVHSFGLQDKEQMIMSLHLLNIERMMLLKRFGNLEAMTFQGEESSFLLHGWL